MVIRMKNVFTYKMLDGAIKIALAFLVAYPLCLANPIAHIALALMLYCSAELLMLASRTSMHSQRWLPFYGVAMMGGIVGAFIVFLKTAIPGQDLFSLTMLNGNIADIPHFTEQPITASLVNSVLIMGKIQEKIYLLIGFIGFFSYVMACQVISSLFGGNRRSNPIVIDEYHHMATHYAKPRTGMSIQANKFELKQDK